MADIKLPSKKGTVIKSLLLLAGNSTALATMYSYLSGEKLAAEAKKVEAGISKVATEAKADWSISIMANGKNYVFTSPDVLMYGTLLAFFLVVLVQVVLDRQPWNSLFTKQLGLYMIIAFGAIAGLILVTLNWFTEMNPAVLVTAGTALGYIIFRITHRIAGKPILLP